MSGQCHVADGHPQFPFGDNRLNPLNLAGRKLHHCCTVSAPPVRFDAVQFFALGIGGGAVHFLDLRLPLGQVLAAGEF